jgi:hypothetical protein
VGATAAAIAAIGTSLVIPSLRDGGVAVGVVPRTAQDASAIKEKLEEFRGDNIITILPGRQ